MRVGYGLRALPIELQCPKTPAGLEPASRH